MIFSLEAEKSVLGAILIDGDSLLKAADILSLEDFYHSAHVRIFSACLDVYQDGSPVDIATVAERLRAINALDEIGGIAYLSQLANETPIAANIGHYAQIVRKYAITRRARLWALEIQKEAETSVEDLPGWFGRMEQGIIDLSETVREKKSPHAADILREILADWEESKLGKKNHTPCRAFEKFNASGAIPGFYPGHLWMIGGYTSAGKSTFLAQLLTDACQDGAKVCIFSTEDGRKEKMMKIIGNLADVSQRRQMAAEIEGFEDRIREAMNTIKQWGLLTYDDVTTADEIRLKAKKHKLQGGLDIVCLDYVQNLAGDGNLYERMSDAAGKLFRMGKELGVTVIVLSQVNNESMKGDSEIIGLKGAGELASAADIVLWLKRVKGCGNERHLDCEIRKNRPFGETGVVEMQFSDYWTRIERR